MRRQRGSRRVAPALVVIAAAAVALLLITVTADVWAGASIALTTVLALSLLREVVIRLNADRALVRATSALRELSTGTADESERSVPELLDALADRLCPLLHADWSAVSITDDTGSLRVESTSGAAPVAIGEERDGHTIPRDHTPHRLAVPLAIGASQLGVVEIGVGSGRRFSRTDHELLRILADNLSTTVERARLVDAERRSRLGSSHARAHLALLTEVSIVLARALEDPRPALAESAQLISTMLADACAIHLNRVDGTLERVAVVEFPILDFDATTGAPYEEFARRFPAGSDALQRVMETGDSELSYVAADGRIVGANDAMAEALRASGMTSWVVAPIRVRGLAVGTLVVGTRRGRRGLRASDQTTVDELSNRMAIVIERGQLYQASRQAGVAAERRAAQLSNLLEATLVFNRSLQTQELLDVLVAQARRVLGASHSRAWLSREPTPEAMVGERLANAVRLGSPLVDATGGGIGFLTIERDPGQPFTGDEEAVLLLLARLASVALQNARLYDDLRQREERLSALFAASPLAVLELDLAGAVRDVNPAARRLFRADDAAGVTLPDMFSSGVGALVASAIEHGFAEAEVSVLIGDEPFELWVSTAPLRRPHGTPDGVLMVINDTTGRKRLEEQLIEAHRYEAIAQLAGGIAHDFNNLLTIIVGYSDLALRADGAAAVHEELTAINEAGQLAAVITNQLLMLSRRQILKPVVVSLASACESLIPTLRRLVGNRVVIDARCDVEVAIKIDQGQLEQILFNLVLNSRDAMGNNGTITIETTLGADGRDIALTVSDTGAGMDADTLARCREPFFTSKGRRGIGLGLATVSSIVDRAGGRLDIESELGQGTTIAAYFPVAVRAEAEAEAEVGPHQPARVLLVDDDELIRRYADQVLVDAGYQVVSFGDAEAAVAWVDAGEPFDLLVSDVVLPGMSGFELVRAVEHRRPSSARLLMTGFAGTDTWGTDLADVQLLSKPFSIDEFLKAVGSSLEEVAQGSKR